MPTRRHTLPTLLFCLLIAMVIACGLTLESVDARQDRAALPDLTLDRQVYDLTGSSLSPEQATSIQARIDQIERHGASVVVVVRNLMATPEETLDQVEQMQQAWVAATGVNQDTAVAILINRNPDDLNDARAGIFVGRTYHDGNVPESELRAIVEQALIPPLRHGDVNGSLTNGLIMLEDRILNGPPPKTRNGFERFSDRVTESWLPSGIVAMIGVLGVGLILPLRNRLPKTRQSQPPATTDRPGSLTPALAGALVAGGPQASAIPATILDLARRGALRIESETEKGTFSSPKILVRLVDESVIRDEVEVAVWKALQRHNDEGIVSSKELALIAGNTSEVFKVLKAQMDAAVWRDLGHGRRALGGWLGAILVFAIGILVTMVAAESGSIVPMIGIAGLVALLAALLFLIGSDSPLTVAGQEAALPWKAYKTGLKVAARDSTRDLDLDSALADSIAFNLGTSMQERLEEAEKSGVVLQAFSGTMTPASDGGATVRPFVYWTAFNSSFATSSGGSGSTGTVSGGGSGGGGGAAGST